MKESVVDWSVAWRRGASLVLGAILLAGSQTAPGQTWSKGSYLNSSGSCPPFVFVAMAKAKQNFGFDAIANHGNGGRLHLGSPGRELWFMHKSLQDPVLIFPLPNKTYACELLFHGPCPSTSGPVPLQDGSVHEPHVYHHPITNQYWVFFSYARDLANPAIERPCDIYAINVTPIMLNPSLDPTNLVIRRITSAARTQTELMERSFNPRLMPQDSFNTFLTWEGGFDLPKQFETNTGACVVDEEHGPVLYWASNERRADGEGMFAGDLEFNPSDVNSVVLVNKREVFQFGTTSLISFFPSPRGAGGSYRSNTESTGQWGIFEFRSDEAEWQTISGYSNQENIVDHNATTIAVNDDPDDSLIAISRYYIGNNEGFGTIIVLPYSEVGRNTDNGFTTIGQVGNFTGGARNLFGIGEFEDINRPEGKFALPVAGRRNVPNQAAELFLSYSAGPAHGHESGPNTYYHSKLVVVTDISAPIAPAGGTYLNAPVLLLLEHPNYHAFAMQPLLTHKERFGWKHRTVQSFPGRLDPATLPADVVDLPVAQVMAGPIYNTDVRAIKRRLTSHDPTLETFNNQGSHLMSMRVSCLTKDRDPSYYGNPASFADPDNPDKVWGVRIFVTDPMTRKVKDPNSNPAWTQPYWPDRRWGYLHHRGDGDPTWGDVIAHERYRHLSDVPADAQGMVNFVLPANVPVKFNLLHKDGTILAPHRNHHSFAPGQLEQRCAGCHQHVTPGSSPAFVSGTAFDTMTQTGRYGWDINGNPQFTTVNQPTVAVPEFRADVFPLMETHCADCHDTSDTQYIATPNPAASSKWNMDMARVVQASPSISLDKAMANWLWLNKERLINRRYGAAKSPLAWHFAGQRLDGESNASYPASSGSRYYFTPANHPGLPDKREAYRVVEWLDAGAAIDHGAVKPNGTADATRGVKGDGYQIALSARLAAFRGSDLQIGFWDVDANVKTISVTLRGVTVTHTLPGNTNGAITHDLLQHVGGGGPLLPHEVVSIEAIDTPDNHSRLQKTLRQLYVESETNRGKLALSISPLAIGQAGGSFQFNLDGSPSVAGGLFFLTFAGGFYPGYPDPGFEVYLLPDLDAWFSLFLGLGVLGTLDANGNGSYTLPIPANTPPFEVYGTANAFLSNGTAVKSNLRAIQVK